MSDMITLPPLPALARERYDAATAGALDALDCSAIRQRVDAFGHADRPQESYLTGWMAFNPLVIIRNYQDKRGTSSGVVLSVGDAYRFSVQTITPRIPKLLLWATLRSKPKTLPLVALQDLAAGDRRLVPYRAVRDTALREQMTGWWAEINDYLGIACWQHSHGYPQWQALENSLSCDAVSRLHQWLQRDPQTLEHDGDYAGRWYDGLFIATRAASESNPWPSLLMSWKSPQRQASYLIGWLAGEADKPTLALALRPDAEMPFFTLNRFDAEHLQRLAALNALATQHAAA
ncbi:hypothetical protein ACRZZR_001739 [Edwardsiella piscicida]